MNGTSKTTMLLKFAGGSDSSKKNIRKGAYGLSRTRITSQPPLTEVFALYIYI